MQEILQKLIADHAGEWKGMLMQKLGLDAQGAGSFLNGLVERIGGALSSGKLEPAELAKGFDAGTLMKGIDLQGLASQAGITEEKTEEGVRALAPELSSAVTSAMSEGGLSGMLGDTAGKTLGKLFGR